METYLINNFGKVSQNKAKFVALQDKQGAIFTGGIIDNSENWMIPYSNTPYARNFRVGGRGISQRLGFSQFGNNLGTSDYPRGISAYYRSAVANDRIIVRYNIDGTHKLVSVVPLTGLQTSIDTSTNITSDNRMNFISANDSLYCMNGVDEMGKLNGTNYSKPSLGITLKPSFAAFFDNSLFVSGDATSPNSLYKSAENNPESFSGTGSDLFTASYPINGLASAGQTLYIFSENSIDMINNNSIKQIGSTLVYTSLPLEAYEGAMNYNTIGVFGRDVYFLSKSGKIKKIAPNGMLHYDVVELSHRANKGINKTMESLDSDQSAGFCYVVPELQIIKWHLKSKGSNFNDICIVYNTEYDAFMVDDHKVFYGGCNYKTKNFTISQIEPKLYLDEYGYTDDDSPIQFRYDTKVMNFGDPTINKRFWQIRTYLSINKLAKVYQNVYVDGTLIDSKLIDSSTIPLSVSGIGTKPIGTFAIGTEGAITDELYNTTIVRDKGYLRTRGKTLQISYTSSELGAKLLLQYTEPQTEMLYFLTTSTNGYTYTTSINLTPLQDSLGNNITDIERNQLYSIIEVTV